jgi:FG-GAP-like repeat/Putative metal-binding motif/FG-GAP repeat
MTSRVEAGIVLPRADSVIHPEQSDMGHLNCRRSVRLYLLAAAVTSGCAPSSEGPDAALRGAGLPVCDSLSTTGPAPGTLAPLLNLSWTAEADQDYAAFGVAIATAGDVNGDGYADLAVAGTLWDGVVTGSGLVRVYHGSATGLEPAPAWAVESDQSSSYFGDSIASAGDVDGDGYDDLLVGAFFYDNGQTDNGQAWLYRGSATGLESTASWTAAGVVEYGARFAEQVSSAGDVNADGYDDVLVGALNYDADDVRDEGVVFLYLGSAAGLSATPDWTATSDQKGSSFGENLAPAGDVDGDGFDDVLLPARSFDNGQTDEGKVWLYRGAAGGLEADPAWSLESNQGSGYLENYEWFSGGRLGDTVAGLGDVNGDGFDDFAIGSDTYLNDVGGEGVVFVFHGSPTGPATVPDWTANGVEGQGPFTFAFALAAAGDANGDGYADLAVSSVNENGESEVSVYLGGATGLAHLPAWAVAQEQASSSFAMALAGAGDVDADGFDDLAIGAGTYDGGNTDEGRASLYLGGCPGQSGDTDGDGVEDDCDVCPGSDDFVFNADWDVACAFPVAGMPADCDDEDPQSYPGAVERCDGLDNACAGWIAPAEDDSDGDGFRLCHLGPEADERVLSLSWSVGFPSLEGASSIVVGPTPGDVNGDGYDDLLVVGTEDGASRSMIHLGSAAGPETTPQPTLLAPSGTPLTLIRAGDIDGDGFADMLGLADGEVYLHGGSASGLSAVPAWTAPGAPTSDWHVSGRLPAGDVNGDGQGDILMTQPTYSGAEFSEGRALLYLGSGLGFEAEAAWTAESDAAYANFGSAATAAGDVNGDGYGDVVIGAPQWDDDLLFYEGRAYLYLGGPDGLSSAPAWTADGEQGYARFGSAVGGANESNGDG